MEGNKLVNALHIVELSATTRSNAIRELVDAVNWGTESVLPEDVVKAIEEREATAQTIVDKGLALPHAMIQWNGDFRIVLGRSQRSRYGDILLLMGLDKHCHCRNVKH